MNTTEEQLMEIQWAWKLYKTSEQLQLMLLQKYHQEFIVKMENECALKEMELRLPF